MLRAYFVPKPRKTMAARTYLMPNNIVFPDGYQLRIRFRYASVQQTHVIEILLSELVYFSVFNTMLTYSESLKSP